MAANALRDGHPAQHADQRTDQRTDQHTDQGGSTTTLSLVGAAADAPLRDRIIGATLRCLARWGVTKTTLDDIAREAGCSRATVYRCFPGGKDVLLHEAAEHEILAFYGEVADDLGRARDLGDALTRALFDAACRLRRHDALQYLVAHEPGLVLPYISFDGIQPLLDLAVAVVGPLLEPHLPAGVPSATAGELAEWLVRIIVSYAFDDEPAVDLTDAAACRRFVATFALPGLGLVPAVPDVDHVAATAAASPDPTTEPTTEPTPGPTTGNPSVDTTPSAHVGGVPTSA